MNVISKVIKFRNEKGSRLSGSDSSPLSLTLRKAVTVFRENRSVKNSMGPEYIACVTITTNRLTRDGKDYILRRRLAQKYDQNFVEFSFDGSGIGYNMYLYLLLIKGLTYFIKNSNELQVVLYSVALRFVWGNNSRPQRIILSCYYTNIGLAVIKAANELNIPVLEYQHGQQGAGNELYYKFPSEDYYFFKNVTFGCWDNIVQRRFDSMGINSLCIGNLWFSQSPIIKDENIALVALQDFKRSDLDWDSLIFELNNYERIIIKPHPRNVHDTIIGSFESSGLKCEIVYTDIQEVLALGPCVYTLYSTVGYEAMLRGLEVVIIGSKGYQMYREYLEANKMRRVGCTTSGVLSDSNVYNDLRVWMKKGYQ